jgi:drug/metabolite transporter (DMT)-like permease
MDRPDKLTSLTILANDSLLLLTAVIWGAAFVAQRVGMEHVGPFTYNAVRFAVGSLSLLPLLALRRRRAATPSAPAARGKDRRVTAGVLLAGVILFAGSSLQQSGMVYTSAGKAGFITGLYVVLVPLTGLLRRQRAGWSAWTGAALAAVGLFFISVTRSFGVEAGDLAVLAGAFFWAAHVQMVGWLSRRMDPLALNVVQCAVCSLASAGVALAREGINAAGILSAAVPILYGGLLSTGVAFTLQAVAQRSAPPAHAAILLSLESLFAALAGAVILGERMGLRAGFGCAVMLGGMVVSQVPRLRRGGGIGYSSGGRRPGGEESA